MNRTYCLSSVPGFDELVATGMNGSTPSLLLNRMECFTNHAVYHVIRYDKDIFKEESVSTIGLCRSVVVNSDHQVVGFSPPKSISADVFIQKYPQLKSPILVEEFVEGTMVNVFFDPSVGVNDWVIATKNNVGATCRFYQKTPHAQTKTFRQMFLEAADVCQLDIRELNKNVSYSFVLQHPDNRIVIPFHAPQLYLVALYTITKGKDGATLVEYEHPSSCNVANRSDVLYLSTQTKVRYPVLYKDYDTYSALIQQFGSMNTPYDVMGVVLYHSETGERSKIRNPVYEQVRELRGNQPKMQYHYLCLRKEGRVKEFLKYYPEYNAEFADYRDKVHMFTNTLYDNYVSCYIQKRKPLLDYVKEYRTHMYTIHQKFINELREKKQKVTKYVVQEYVNQLHPALLMYCLNYPGRQQLVDQAQQAPTPDPDPVPAPVPLHFVEVFDLQKLTAAPGDNCSAKKRLADVLIVGKRNTGELALAKQIIQTYSIPATSITVVGLDQSRFADLPHIRHVRGKYKENKQVLKEIVEGQQRDFSQPMLIVLDQCFLTSDKDDSDLTCYLMNSRHYNITLVVLVDSPVRFSIPIRMNFDYLFVFRQDPMHPLFDVHPYFTIPKSQLDELVNGLEDNECMVIHQHESTHVLTHYKVESGNGK